MKIRLRFAWYDMWIGAYWDRKQRVLYICPLPTVLLEVSHSRYLYSARQLGYDIQWISASIGLWCQDLGYLIRPYDMLADKRRWFWQPRFPCARSPQAQRAAARIDAAIARGARGQTEAGT